MWKSRQPWPHSAEIFYHQLKWESSEIINYLIIKRLPDVTRNYICTVFGNLGCTENGNNDVHINRLKIH